MNQKESTLMEQTESTLIKQTEPALMPANLYTNAKQERFQDSYRRWQGIPSIEVSRKGRIFINFYSGLMDATHRIGGITMC